MDYRVLDADGKPALVHVKRDVTGLMQERNGEWLVEGCRVHQLPSTVAPNRG